MDLLQVHRVTSHLFHGGHATQIKPFRCIFSSLSFSLLCGSFSQSFYGHFKEESALRRRRRRQSPTEINWAKMGGDFWGPISSLSSLLSWGFYAGASFWMVSFNFGVDPPPLEEKSAAFSREILFVALKYLIQFPYCLTNMLFYSMVVNNCNHFH